MRVNLIGNPTSPGLARDMQILRDRLEAQDCKVHDIDMFSPTIDVRGSGADINIFLESLRDGRYLQGHALTNWFIPNPEWYFPEQWDKFLPYINLVCCKTSYAYQLWRQKLTSNRVEFLGFESVDRYRPGIRTERKFLHCAGKSTAKGTHYVAEAWYAGACPHPLTLVTCLINLGDTPAVRQLVGMFGSNPWVRHEHNLSESAMDELMNSHQFMVLPSLAEGYGHILHEAMSARMVVITTSAPPMNESPGIDRRMLVPVVKVEPRMMTVFSHVSGEGIRKAVTDALALSDLDIQSIGDNARMAYLNEREYFRDKLRSLVTRWEDFL